jgi:transcriptional regulator with XRE-family HTH domain
VSGSPEPRPFGERLPRLREAAHLTQSELAERAGLSANGVIARERGVRRRPHPHTLRALAAALGTSGAEGRSGRWERAAVLIGAAEAMRSSSLGSGYNYYLPDAALEDRTVAEGRAALGAGFDEALSRGRALPADVAVDRALEGAA